jgi:hypothetical protein
MINKLETEQQVQDIYHSDNVQIESPEQLFFNINGKRQSLIQHLSSLMKITEITPIRAEDFSEDLGISAKLYFEVRQGNIYFDADFKEDNKVGYFSGLFIKCSCPKLINPKIIAKMFVAYSNGESYIQDELDSDLNINNSENIETTIKDYILGAKTRKESSESVNNNHMHYETLELRKSFYQYLETFKE